MLGTKRLRRIGVALAIGVGVVAVAGPHLGVQIGIVAVIAAFGSMGLEFAGLIGDALGISTFAGEFITFIFENYGALAGIHPFLPHAVGLTGGGLLGELANRRTS